MRSPGLAARHKVVSTMRSRTRPVRRLKPSANHKKESRNKLASEVHAHYSFTLHLSMGQGGLAVFLTQGKKGASPLDMASLNSHEASASYMDCHSSDLPFWKFRSASNSSRPRSSREIDST